MSRQTTVLRAAAWLCASIVGLGLAVWLADRPFRGLSDESTEIRGVVTDAHGPLAGATVRFKGHPESVVTDEHGRFAWNIPSARIIRETITASRPGYLIGGVSPDAPVKNIRLEPLPTEDNPHYQWIDPTPDTNSEHNCGNCHRVIFDEWRGSGHASSLSNRRFRNLYEGTDWHEQPHVGDSLLADHPHGAGVCASCHAPGAAVDDPTNFDIRQVGGVDGMGVHCDYCHKVQDASTENLGLTHGKFGLRILRPERGQLFFGPLDDVDRGEDSYSPVHRESRYCAACHEGVLFGVHVYSTYSEWLASPAAREGRTCQSCHMAPTGRLSNFAPGSGGLNRDPRTLASHAFLPGGRMAMLKRCLHVEVDVENRADGFSVEVQITAHDVGHRVPTGFIDRQLLLVIEPSDADGIILESESAVRLPDAAGASLSGRAGRLFARLLTDEDGQSPVPFWRATTDPEDTRLRPGEPVITQVGLPATTRSVRVRLLYRRFWSATAEEKSWPDDTLVVFDETRPVPGR